MDEDYSMEAMAGDDAATNDLTDNGDGTYSDSYGDTYDADGNLIAVADDSAPTDNASAQNNAEPQNDQPAGDQNDGRYLVTTTTVGGEEVGWQVLDTQNQNAVVYSASLDQATGEIIVDTDLLGLSDPLTGMNPQLDTGLIAIDAATSQQLMDAGGGGGSAASDGGVLTLPTFVVTGSKTPGPSVVIGDNPVIPPDVGFIGTGSDGGNSGSGTVAPPVTGPTQQPVTPPRQQPSSGSGNNPTTGNPRIVPVVPIRGGGNPFPNSWLNGISTGMLGLLLVAGIVYASTRDDKKA